MTHLYAERFFHHSSLHPVLRHIPAKTVRKDQLTPLITRLALSVAVVVATSLPLGYALTSLQDAAEALEFKALVKSSALNELIAYAPDLGMFAEQRIQNMLTHGPVALKNEQVQIFDTQGQLLLQSGSTPMAPVLRKSASLLDTGQVVGRVVVVGSQRQLVYKTLVAALIGLSLGLLVFMIMRVLPLRVLRRVRSSLNEEKDRVKAMLCSISDAVITTDAQGAVKRLNPASMAMLELDSPEQLLGRAMLEMIAPEYRKVFTQHHHRVLAGEALQIQYEVIGAKGARHWWETSAVSLLDRGKPVYLAVARDITERKKADAELERHRHHLEELVQERTAELRVAAAAFDSQEAMMVTDASHIILKINRAFCQITGHAANEIVGQDCRLLGTDPKSGDDQDALWDAVRHNGGWQGEVWGQRKSGERYPKWLTVSALRDEDGMVTHYISAHHDITERKNAEAEIRSLAFYDHLTGLPNRRLLLDRLTQTIAAGKRSNQFAALLFIDLDNFKNLNDTLGHDIGDLLLQQVAKRLQTCVREGDTVARLGGDEFVVMLEHLSVNTLEAAMQTEVVGKNILACLNQPYLLGHHKYQSTPSIGATVFDGLAGTLDELLKRADLAMYQAKAAGRNALRFYDPQMQAVVMTRAALESDLREAIAKEQLVLHYQAQVDALGQMLGVEALVRWHDPRHGMVSPQNFIPLAEETGLILPLGRWVLKTACRQLATWAAQEDMAHLTVAVNVSARQLRQKDFVEEVLDIVLRTGANPARLKLELTESLLVNDVEDVITKMEALRAKDIRFSLDDFGTGYSSLSYLKRLPLEQLKIDQSFVRNILTDSNDAAIAKMVLALADSLGLSVIAEGVETEAQKNLLMAQGCHAYQGYFCSRPLPLDAFEAFAKGSRFALRHTHSATPARPARSLPSNRRHGARSWGNVADTLLLH